MSASKDPVRSLVEVLERVQNRLIDKARLSLFDTETLMSLCLQKVVAGTTCFSVLRRTASAMTTKQKLIDFIASDVSDMNFGVLCLLNGLFLERNWDLLSEADFEDWVTCYGLIPTNNREVNSRLVLSMTIHRYLTARIGSQIPTSMLLLFDVHFKRMQDYIWTDSPGSDEGKQKSKEILVSCDKERQESKEIRFTGPNNEPRSTDVKISRSWLCQHFSIMTTRGTPYDSTMDTAANSIWHALKLVSNDKSTVRGLIDVFNIETLKKVHYMYYGSTGWTLTPEETASDIEKMYTRHTTTSSIMDVRCLLNGILTRVGAGFLADDDVEKWYVSWFPRTRHVCTDDMVERILRAQESVFMSINDKVGQDATMKVILEACK